MARTEKAPLETQLTKSADSGQVEPTRRILVVDDEETLLFATAKMLRKQGFSVLTAGNGVDAVDVLRTHKDDISLVFLDVTIPGLSSREVLEEARRLRPDAPVILTSAHGHNMIDSLFAGVPSEHFIPKPYRLAALVDLFQMVLRGS